jgi:cell division protein FtsI (penicillin-binding protein 3)
VKSADVRRSAQRVAIARAGLLVAFVVLGLRAVQLSMFDSRAADHGNAQTLRTVTLPPERGALLDRSGAALALSIDAPSVYVEPTQLADPAEAARRLGALFRRDPRQLEKRLRERRAFLFIERWVDEERAARVEALGLRGVGILHEPRRVYPHKALAARVIGFANIDGRGVRGIEQQEDDWLSGTARRLPMERDGRGRKMLVSGGSSWGTAGGDVALTLDAAMQADAERALQEAIRATGAQGGVVISMDPWSGEIYALAEAPGFDPNHFRSLDYAATRSAAFLDVIEPGSAFKPFLIASALEQGAIAPDQWIDCGDGTLRVPGKTIRDLHPHPQLDPAGILRVSSNVGAVRVAQELGPGPYHQMLERFGFGASTGSGFPDESAGVLRDWHDWKPVDHATIAFGQGVSVTPIQLAAATAALANGGEWVRPRLVAARRAAESPWQRTPRESLRRVLHPDTARRVVEMMEGVVSAGGHRLARHAARHPGGRKDRHRPEVGRAAGPILGRPLPRLVRRDRARGRSARRDRRGARRAAAAAAHGRRRGSSSVRAGRRRPPGALRHPPSAGTRACADPRRPGRAASPAGGAGFRSAGHRPRIAGRPPRTGRGVAASDARPEPTRGGGRTRRRRRTTRRGHAGKRIREWPGFRRRVRARQRSRPSRS